MKTICAISDMHGQLPSPGSFKPHDIMIIAGDICPHFGSIVGGFDDVLGQSQWLQSKFANWLNKIPAKHIVSVFGNHDWVAERNPELIPNNLRWNCLKDNSVIIEGIKIWGSPFQLNFYNWAFNAPMPHEEGEIFLKEKYELIPEDTDIIISHGPPYSYGDMTDYGIKTGSKSLLKRAEQLPNLKYLITGHIHSNNAIGIHSHPKGFKVVNSSVLNEQYKLTNPPIYIEI